MPSTCLAEPTAVASAKGSKSTEPSTEMRVIHLNLSDLEELIRGYEIQYHVSTVAMLSNADVRTKINEDDLLQWEAYVNQRSGLREYYEMVHREYLHNRNRNILRRKKIQEDPTEYAA